IETKFTSQQTGAPDIDSFMTKIVRKADNTMGILISMAGFTKVAIKEASRDRTPMLLMDYSHFYSLILPSRMSLPEVIRRIKRHASQTGEAFLLVERFSG
ncbi:MAG: restriction endonuclease, partial [Candidatus Zixiibacteriota bacterium]